MILPSIKVKARRTHGIQLWFWHRPGCHALSWPIHTLNAAGTGAHLHASECAALADLIWRSLQ